MKDFVLKILLLSMFFPACAKPREEPETPMLDHVALYGGLVTRLFENHMEGPFVVSRWAESGEPEHQGEGLLWSGVALSSMRCEEGRQIEDGLIAMIEENDGFLIRFSPLGEYAGGREITWDGAVGLYHGIASRLDRCPDSPERWSPVWASHLAALERADGRLHPNTTVRVPPAHGALLGAIGARLELADPPSANAVRALGLVLAEWAAAVVVTKSPAYRLNLAMLTIEAMEWLGHSMEQTRALFCTQTRGVRIPTVDAHCGRGSLRTWVEHEFDLNIWEFRHQRSGSWESPDGKPGLETPGLDGLVGLTRGWEIL